MVRGDRLPLADGGPHALKDCASLRGVEAVELGRGQSECHVGRGIAGVDRQLVVASFDVRIEIVGGRKPPAVRGQNEAMVAQVIVPVENDARPQLVQVCLLVRRPSPRAEKFCEFQIAGVLAILSVQQCHRGYEEAPPAVREPVKPAAGKGPMPAAQAEQLGVGHVQAGGVGELMHHHFPSADVAAVLAARKLGDPQGSFRVGKIGFGPGSAERTAGGQQGGQPLAKLGLLVGIRRFERQRSGLEFAQ